MIWQALCWFHIKDCIPSWAASFSSAPKACNVKWRRWKLERLVNERIGVTKSSVSKAFLRKQSWHSKTIGKLLEKLHYKFKFKFMVESGFV